MIEKTICLQKKDSQQRLRNWESRKGKSPRRGGPTAERKISPEQKETLFLHQAEKKWCQVSGQHQNSHSPWITQSSLYTCGMSGKEKYQRHSLSEIFPRPDLKIFFLRNYGQQVTGTTKENVPQGAQTQCLSYPTPTEPKRIKWCRIWHSSTVPHTSSHGIYNLDRSVLLIKENSCDKEWELNFSWDHWYEYKNLFNPLKRG